MNPYHHKHFYEHQESTHYTMRLIFHFLHYLQPQIGYQVPIIALHNRHPYPYLFPILLPTDYLHKLLCTHYFSKFYLFFSRFFIIRIIFVNSTYEYGPTISSEHLQPHIPDALHKFYIIRVETQYFFWVYETQLHK